MNSNRRALPIVLVLAFHLPAACGGVRTDKLDLRGNSRLQSESRPARVKSLGLLPASAPNGVGAFVFNNNLSTAGNAGADWVAPGSWCGQGGFLIAGDFNGDGKVDLLCNSYADGTSYFAYASNNGLFNFANIALIPGKMLRCHP